MVVEGVMVEGVIVVVVVGGSGSDICSGGGSGPVTLVTLGGSEGRGSVCGSVSGFGLASASTCRLGIPFFFNS